MSSERFLSKKVQTIPPSGIRKFFDLANQMEGVVSLGVGEPDFDTPWHIRAEAIYAIESGRTHYTGNRGLDKLRKEICNYYHRRFGVDYEWEKNVLVTVGASEGIDLVMRSVLDPGDEVIILEPSYVAYVPTVMMSGGTVKYIHLKEEERFKLTPEALEAAITDKTKLLFINYPSNPTGGTMSREDYEKLVPIIKKHDILVLSDEIYAELSYAGGFASIAAFDEIKDQVIVLNGFSKAYSMTGWRLGYILADEALIKHMNIIHQHTIMCATSISQFAGIEAISKGDSDCEYHKSSFEARRNVIVNGLNRLGLKCHMPEGAFYVFPSIKCTGLTSEEFCERLLNEQKVAVVPGSAFGPSGEGYVRISYAYSIEQIKTALERMEVFMKQFRQE